MINANRNVETAKRVEEDVAFALEKRLSVGVIMMPEFSKFDYLITRPGDNGFKKAVAIAEFRHRPDVRINQYDTVFLDKQKVTKMQECAEAMCLPALFIVKWMQDVPRWIDINGFTGSRMMKRRVEERSADRAMEVCLYPTNRFKFLILK